MQGLSLTRFFKYLGATLLLCVLTWQWLPHTEKLPVDTTQNLVPDWFGKDVHVLEMNESGLPKRSFQADKIVHYASHDITDLFNPEFTLFGDAAEVTWHLKGKKGRTFHGQRTTDILRLDLWHDVQLSQQEDSRKMQVFTSTIAIFPETQFAQTDQAVELTQPGHTLTGVGLKAYFENQSVELLSNVRSEHVQSVGG